jgi:hypothetical protein
MAGNSLLGAHVFIYSFHLLGHQFAAKYSSQEGIGMIKPAEKNAILTLKGSVLT